MTNYSGVTNTCSFSVRGWYITDSHLIYENTIFWIKQIIESNSMIQIEYAKMITRYVKIKMK